jgi:signal transduction histidine kinase
MKFPFSTFENLKKRVCKLKTRKTFSLFIFLLLRISESIAQAGGSLPVIDISKIKYSDSLYFRSELAFGGNETITDSIEYLSYVRVYKPKIGASLVPRPAVLRFHLTNSSESSASVYFYPGKYFPELKIYRQTGGKRPEPVPDILPAGSDNLSYRKLTLAAKETALFYAVIRQVKTANNKIKPSLVNEIYILPFIAAEENEQPEVRLFTLILCGLLLMMMFFSLITYSLGANKEFLHYAFYVFFLAILLFIKAYNGNHSNRFNFFFEGPLDFILFSAGHLFYFLFIRRFLDAGHKYPFVNTICKTGVTSLVISAVVYCFFHFFTSSFLPEHFLELVLKILLLILAVFFVFYARRRTHDKVMRYLAWGNGCLFILSVASLILVMAGAEKFKLPLQLNNSFIYYQAGIFLELVFFLAGLTYKNKKQIIEQTRERERLKAENQMKEYEKELAVLKAQKEERNRIAQDMHDELGSGMTGIKMMNELAKSKIKVDIPAEMHKISQSADDVLGKMNAVIWSMNSKNDTLDNLVSYIRVYAMEYLENSPVACKVHIPEKIEEKELSGDKRRNIFLCVKESLNNVLKHSGASLLTINIETNHQLIIRIHDNGRGIDLQNLRQFGNGLKNIQNRMLAIGGNFTIEKKDGTVTTLTLPL